MEGAPQREGKSSRGTLLPDESKKEMQDDAKRQGGQDQANDLGDQLFSAVAGLFYGDDQSSFVESSPPEKDPLSVTPSKPKRHERNVSWGFLPSKADLNNPLEDNDEEEDVESSNDPNESFMPSSLWGTAPPVHPKPVHKRKESFLPDSLMGKVPSTSHKPAHSHKESFVPNSLLLASTPSIGPKPVYKRKEASLPDSLFGSTPMVSPKSAHKRKESFLPESLLGNNSNTPSFSPKPAHQRKETFLTEGSVPSVIAIDPLERRSSALPSEKPAHTRRRTLTSTQDIPTDVASHTNATKPNRRHHNRSLTMTNFSTTEISPPSDISHVTMDHHDVSSLPPPGSNSSSSNISNKPKAAIKLQDVIMTAPFELEAETHILRALEQAQVEDNNTIEKPTLEPETPTILPHVPDNTAHGFVVNPSVEAGEGTEVNIEEQGFECVDVQSTRTNQAVKLKKETKPLLPNKKKSHRPTKSVEQKLFGLTAALSAMDDTGRGEKGENENNDDSGDKKEAAVSGLPATDKVAKTAQSLANRLKREQSIRHLNVEPCIPEAHQVNGGIGRAESLRFEVSMGGEEGGDVPTKGSQPNDDVESLTSAESSKGTHNDSQQQTENDTTLNRKLFNRRRRRRYSVASTRLKDDWDLFSEILSPREASTYMRYVLLFLILPATGIAALLFYFFDNPHTGHNTDAADRMEEEHNKASISWWLIFLFVRQVITLSLALATQVVIIDFLATGSWIFLRFFGPIVTLFLAQSRGWPFVLVFWGLYDLALLSGSSAFAKHWAYAQGWIAMFTDSNPPGQVTSNEVYYQVIQIAIGVGVAVSLKRLVVGLFLGRQTFGNYAHELARLMEQVVLVSSVAGLGNQIYRSRNEFALQSSSWDFELNTEELQKVMAPIKAEKEEAKAEHQARQQQEGAVYQDDQRHSSGLLDLLERWEEPDSARQDRKKRITVSSVLQFRRALSSLQRKNTFSNAFGPCETRQECCESTSSVYDKLMLRTPGREELDFETIALVATNNDGSVDEGKVMSLIKLFRPARNGKLTKLEFVKSVDNVYRSHRLLLATIANSGQIDQAFENILNVLFYIILGCIILSVLGFDPLALFISFSSVFLAFAFIFSSASAKYFEGMIFILVQRPYGVGDRIHVSGVNDETDPNGSSGWIVERVTLFSTTAYWVATNECATISNAAIANSRIINAARSPHAKLQVTMTFGIDVPYERIVIFKSAVEQYMKARPREWLQLVGFRACNVTIDRGFIEYTIIALHRESWQSVGSIEESRATLTSYCLEVAKQLDMRYMSPPLPVSLNIASPPGEASNREQHDAENSPKNIARTDFRSMALSHGIRIE